MTATDQNALGAGLTRPGRVPDILDVIAALSSDAIPTPPLLARALLDLLPAEVWSNPNYRWLDPATKSGSILREAALRLMDGLADWEPDHDRRAEHILRNMLFGCGITQIHGEMTRRSVYVSRDATSEHAVIQFDTAGGHLPFVPGEHDYPVNRQGKASGPCQVCGAPVGLERGPSRENHAYAFIHGAYPTEEMKHMQFDVIVGNPPYQLQTEGFGATASTIYHRFVEHAIALEPKYMAMIIPSRWFSGGKGLDEFRERMIADRRLRVIVDNPKVFDCFPGVKIRGGVNYFLWDQDHNGDCEFATRIDGTIVSTMTRDLREGDGVLVRDNRAMSIVHKVGARSEKSVEGLFTVTKPFGLTMRSNYAGSVPEPFEGAVPLIYASHIGYSRTDQIQRNHEWIDRWKVLLPRASSGDTAQDDQGRIIDVVLGEPIALAPGSACTQTYLIAGMFDTRAETENYAHYLATKFVRFLVLQRKTTQDVTPDRFRFVPFLDMAQRWTDADLYERFGLTGQETAHIEASIKPRTVNLSLDSPIPASHQPGGVKYRPPSTWNETEATETVADEDDQ
jgi:site-specific DNA-methyltransferase (adenine-specific)